jgi:putative membrane protein
MISKRLSQRLIVFSGAFLLTGATAFAQMNPGGGAPQQPSMNSPTNPNGNPGVNSVDNMQAQQASASAGMPDRAFVKKALEGGMAEVQLGQLAAEKGSSDDVKQFGQMMVTDHTKLGDQMKVVAQQLNVTPPATVSKKDKELMTKLQSLSGAEFDNAYIVAMVKDHKKDADEFKAEAQQTQNPALQQVTQQGSQVIDRHLEMIDKIAESHNLMNSKGKMTASGQ